jgi:hypothetical protein
LIIASAAQPRRRRQHNEEPLDTPVTDEEAWAIDTPGDGLLSSRQDKTSYRPEPLPALGTNWGG